MKIVRDVAKCISDLAMSLADESANKHLRSMQLYVNIVHFLKLMRVVLKHVPYLHTTACCVNAYWLTRQPMTWRGLLIHFASSGTIFIFYHVAHYSTYVTGVPNTVELVHHMFTPETNVL